MNMIRNNEYVIGLAGLHNGRTSYEYHVGQDFFDSFGSDMVRNADLHVVADLDKSGSDIRLSLRMDGTVTVECDRCLEDLVLPLAVDVALAVKFVKGAAEDTVSDDVIILEPGDTELDMRQLIYDYVIVGIPLQKVHDIKDCNPDVVRLLGLGENK